MREEEWWQWRLVKKKEKWPMWPALSLELVTANEAKDIKKGGERTPCEYSSPYHSPFEEPGVLCLWAQVSDLGQFRLSEMKRKDYKGLKGNIYKR